MITLQLREIDVINPNDTKLQITRKQYILDTEFAHIPRDLLKPLPTSWNGPNKDRFFLNN